MLRFRSFAWIVALVLVFGAAFVAAQAGQPLLDQARSKKAAGDLQSATEAFEKVVTEFTASDRGTAAKALLELGEIFETLGQSARSRAYYERIQRDFKDQTAEAGIAASRLAGAGRSSPTRITIKTPYADDVYGFAISPDGRTLVFQGTSPEGKRQLWRQAVDASQKPEPIAGTEGAGAGAYPFFSPDGKTIGFFANQKLLQVDLAGGTSKELAVAPSPWGGDWNGAAIVMSGRGLGAPVELLEGGKIRALTTVPGLYMWPKFAGDRRVVYFARDSRGTGVLEVGALDGSAPVPARGLPTLQAAAFSEGYLFYATPTGSLSAVRFDADQGAASGESVLISDRVGRQDRIPGVAAFAVSAAGPVAYRETAVLKKQLMWMDRDGGLVGIVGAPDTASPANLRLSPDGRTLLLFRQAVFPIGHSFIMDTETGALQQFPESTANAIWSPAGDRFLISSPQNQGGQPRTVLVDRPAAGPAGGLARGAAQRGAARRQVGPVQLSQAPEDWAQNGTILFRTSNSNGADGGGDLFAIPAGQNEPIPVAQSPAEERGGRFSPDGNWIAYQSNASGRYEVYVQPFPGTAFDRQRVSLGGATLPQWGRKGSELYFLASDNRLMVTSVELTLSDGKPAVAFGTPKPLFKSPLPPGSEFTTALDGDRFLVVATTEEYPPIIVVSNWMPGK